MKLPKLQELLNYSSKKFYRNRLKDLQHERSIIDDQIKELEDRRDTVDVQINHVENVLGIVK